MLRSASKISFCSVLFLVIAVTVSAADKPLVFVSIPPQKYFVEQIGKDRMRVQVMVQPGVSPATYEPRPRQMAALSRTRVYFAIGVAFENVWLKKIAAANPKMMVVRTDRGIQKIPINAHHHNENAGGRDEDDHPHGADGLDPHIWLSPPLVKAQARTILSALQQIDPAHRDAYESNYHGFMHGIDRLDSELKQLFAGKQGLRFMVFHPSWGYFAQAYRLHQIPIEAEGKNPKPARLRTLIEQAKDAGIRVIFVQPQFSTKSAQLVAREIGGRVIFADPLAEDWYENLRKTAREFKAVLK